MARLTRLETRLLSDDRLELKRWVTWLALLSMIAWFGVGSEGKDPPAHFDFLLEPTRYENAPLSFSYFAILEYTDGPGYLARTYFGFVPLRVASRPDGIGEINSMRGLWHGDGTVTLIENWVHPLRPLKTRMSALATVLLAVALAVRYRPRRSRPPPITGT